MTVAQEDRGRARRARASLGVIDCDVHAAPKSATTVKEYLASRWHVYCDQGSNIADHRGGQVIGARPQTVARRDSIPESGPAGSDLDLLREQLLDPYNVQRAVLIPLEVLSWQLYGEFALALSTALNDWLATEWLDQDDRLYGSITIPLEDGERSAREIARAADDPRFVQVLLTSTTREALGHPKYWPIYEAAVEHGLPVGAHISGFSGTSGATGWGSYFWEFYARYTQPCQAQVVSLIYSGVFEHLPDLRFVLQEQGLAWLPPLMWRLDRTWRELREHVPHLKSQPSDVIRKHFWFTTQPLDTPEKPEYLKQMLDQLDLDENIMFSTDYPHFDFDDPNRLLPASIVGAERRKKILCTNAQQFFNFDRDR